MSDAVLAPLLLVAGLVLPVALFWSLRSRTRLPGAAAAATR